MAAASVSMREGQRVVVIVDGDDEWGDFVLNIGLREHGACGNGLDDDGDGAVDCNDPDCQGFVFCFSVDETTAFACQDGADNDDDVRVAEDRIRHILVRAEIDPNEPLLVEEFVAGPEIAIEGMIHDGTMEVLAVFDKPDPLEGPFFEETYYLTPTRLNPEQQQQLVTAIRQRVDRFGQHCT